MRTSIYVPSTYNNEPIPAGEYERRIRDTAKHMARLFGGATVNKCEGFWIADSGKLVAEDSAEVYSYSDEQETSGIAEYCELLAEVWGQDCIGMAVDGSMEFIYPSKVAVA